MNTQPEPTDDNFDASVDAEIKSCLSLEQPSSFFVFAGAGSGKTRSLEKAIKFATEQHGSSLRLRGKYVGVITYTNAASDEIKRRVQFDPLVKVSTIHSFIWNLIEGFNLDIKEWIEEKLKSDLVALADEQERAKSLKNKTSIARAKRIESKTKRLAALKSVRRFTYNPDGMNAAHDSLAHSEVVGIAAHFLSEKALMQQILVSRFPILLIDESQDTNAGLMDAFMKVQGTYPNDFLLGLFGDTMQRIFNDGKQDLGRDLPKEWKTPSKKMNHRCPPRIVTLINKIRMTTDQQQQRPRSDRGIGVVRLFLVPSSTTSKKEREADIAKQMAQITSDAKWLEADSGVMRLILEHHMASRRMGFAEMFQPLYEVDKLKTGLLDGTLPGIHFFSRFILPLVEAAKVSDEFTIATVVRKFSPLLSSQSLRNAGEAQFEVLKKSREAVEEFYEVCGKEKSPTFGEILGIVARNGLFPIPECFKFYTSRTLEDKQVIQAEAANKAAEEEEKSSALETTNAWERFLGVPFSQLSNYLKYVRGEGGFGTHQGVKGLQFPRVMVIMDDIEAKGWQFSYERLFGAKANNEKTSDDPDRTKRLLYVTCSRAEQSLALVAYSEDPDAILNRMVKDGWFEESEIVAIK